jgi:SAM-dependent methyltransferase
VGRVQCERVPYLAQQVDRNLVQIYRTGDDYRRYTLENPDRRRAMDSFFATYRRYIGHRVLDLCCGGGVLGRVLEQHGRDYVGVDANPDMIRAARKAAKDAGSDQRFVLGDVARARIPGEFDTVTLLGNSLAHLNVDDLDEVLRRRRGNVHPGSTFFLDYRDLIGMFWQGTWSRKKTQSVVGKVVHRTTSLDLERGRLEMRARPSSRKWVLDWAHAIWSPFILESLMRSHGWRLVSRTPSRSKTAAARVPESYVEVYRLAPMPSR